MLVHRSELCQERPGASSDPVRGADVVVELFYDPALLSIALGDLEPSVERHGTRWLVDLLAQRDRHQFIDFLCRLSKVAVQGVVVDDIGADANLLELQRTGKRQKSRHGLPPRPECSKKRIKKQRLAA